MQPPITHYKDEVPADNTQDILNQELDKEAESSAPQQRVELNVLPVEKKEKKVNSSSIVNAFRQKMSTNSIPIDLPSLGKSIDFKEISVTEQKNLSKIAMENDSRADIMYCSMISMINRLALDKKFDIRDCTEFERIAVTLNLQQMNKINTEIKYTCSKCGKENSYRVDIPALLKKFNKSYHEDMVIEVESGSRKFTFTIGWSKVSSVEDFFKNYYKKYTNLAKNIKESMNNLSQIEYITMFIKKVTLSELSDPEDTMTANLEELTYPERVQIIDCLPQSIIFDEDSGIVSKIIENFVNPMNDCFKYNDCAFCGSEQTGGMASITDFLGA